MAEAQRDLAALGSEAVFARWSKLVFQAIRRFCYAMSLLPLADQGEAAARK